MRFEWDPNKYDSNIKKHRVSFDDAILVFSDPVIHLVSADYEDRDEERWGAISRVPGGRGRILFVIYTDRVPDIRRIISARNADQEEINDYYSRINML